MQLFIYWTGKIMTDRKLDNTLKVQRAKKDLTQEDLAELVGVTRKTINTIENRKFIPSTFLALKLSEALEVTVEELFQLRTCNDK
jgi:putative transcriptional regulator